jgi:hypothetical protein
MTSAERPSRLAVALTWLVIGVSAALILLGIFWHGFRLDVQQRFWSDIADRIHGPMIFRFYLQPIMALIAAVVDGLNDARHGHKAFFWTAHNDPTQRAGRLREGLISTARVAALGITMDVIYQFKVFDEFYPAEAVMMALLLAVIPYFIFRWLVELVTNRWIRHTS